MSMGFLEYILMEPCKPQDGLQSNLARFHGELELK